MVNARQWRQFSLEALVEIFQCLWRAIKFDFYASGCIANPAVNLLRVAKE
jgi:hypothetical protein